MTSQKNLSIAHAWFEAFNSHNLEKLLSLYDNEAEHFSPKLKIRHPETNGLVMGKNALRNWWQEAFDRLLLVKQQPKKYLRTNNYVSREFYA